MSNSNLELMEKYGHALMHPKDIAELLSIPIPEIAAFCMGLKEGSTPEARAYRRGIAQAKLELHECVVKLAVKGSPAAQPLADSFLRDL
jgi:hypothetical protein